MRLRDTCYYDRRCGLCRRSRAILQRLDWLDRLAWQDLTALPASELPVAWERAMAGMPMRTRDGRTLVGFPAVRRALRQTPLGFLPACLMHLVGIRGISEVVYNWIARTRRRDACAVSAPASRPASAPGSTVS